MPKRKQPVSLEPKRWVAHVTYRTTGTPPELTVDYEFEELSELAEIVERGPDWRTIVHVCFYMHPSRTAAIGGPCALNLVLPGRV